jgi:hypothetical protein
MRTLKILETYPTMSSASTQQVLTWRRAPAQPDLQGAVLGDSVLSVCSLTDSARCQLPACRCTACLLHSG